MRLAGLVPCFPACPAGLATCGTSGNPGGELFWLRRAAMLVCLFRGGDGELHVLLTKRSSALSTHSGEQLATAALVDASTLVLLFSYGHLL
ncbi:hypothetical protein ABZP36_028906 [Zizania latifolia]